MMLMPAPDPAVLARRGEIVAALRRIVPGRGRHRQRDRASRLRMRRPDRLSATADGGGAAGDDGAGRRGAALLLRQQASRWCRAAPAPRCPAARCRSRTACCSAWASSSASSRSTSPIAAWSCSPASPISPSPRRCRQQGFYYAPDPSSQIACTIGGNVAENSGGVHCLKYGLTTNNVLGVELVTIEGEISGSAASISTPAGYDLLGIVVGSEGLLGVVTEVTVRLLPKPPGARALLIGFPSVEGAGDCVAAIIGAGIIPGGMEMMDRLAIQAAEDFVHAGYPLDVEALLIVELDGCEAEVDHLIAARRGDRRAPMARPPAAPASRRRSGCCSGPGARRLFRRWAASRRTISAWTAPSRARGSARSCCA